MHKIIIILIYYERLNYRVGIRFFKNVFFLNKSEL